MRNFLVLFAFLFLVTTLNAQHTEQYRLKTIVIDPGHGGRDPGCVYGKYYEKDIVLDVALKLGDMIKKAYPDINVVYTRKTDVFIELKERGNIANKAKGDLFISIHVNITGAKSTTAEGTETFTMGIHKSEANLELAKKENSVITFEDGYEKDYQGFDPNDPESYIMFGLGQYGYSMSSILFADMVEKHFISENKSPSRGVKQAGLLVLWYTAMPSILTELGFINNAKDRPKLISSAGRTVMAKSLFNAFSDYKKAVEVESHYESTSAPAPSVELVKYSNKARGYALQLCITSSERKIDKANFGSIYKNVFMLKHGKQFKYLYGLCSDFDDIERMKSKVRQEGKFKDCFIVGVEKGNIVSIKEINKK